MPKRPKRQDRSPIDDAAVLAQWLGADYARESVRQVPDVVTPPSPERISSAAHHPLTLEHYERKAKGRPYKLAIGRLVLRPQAASLQGLVDRSHRLASKMGMNVHSVPTIMSVRHTTMYPPEEADALLQAVKKDGRYAALQEFSDNPLRITGALDVRKRGPEVGVAFRLDALADTSVGLYAERDMVEKVANKVPIDRSDELYPMHIPLVTVSGPQTDEFMDEMSRWWTKYDATQIALSSLGLVAMSRLNRGTAPHSPVS